MICRQLYAANLTEIAITFNVNMNSHIQFLGGYIESAAAACSMVGALTLGVIGDKVDAGLALSINANLASVGTLLTGMLSSESGVAWYVVPRLISGFFGGHAPVFKSMTVFVRNDIDRFCCAYDDIRLGDCSRTISGTDFGEKQYGTTCIVVGPTYLERTDNVFVYVDSSSYNPNNGLVSALAA